MNKQQIVRSGVHKHGLPPTQFIISLMVIIGSFCLVYDGRMEGQAAAALIGGVIWAFAGKEKK
jgi:hypothetical protein